MNRRTLLAVALAVLVSMLFAPHGYKGSVEGWGLFFSEHGLYMHTKWGDVTTAQVGYGAIGRVMIDMLALEIIFLGVLFAIASNLTRRAWRVVFWTAGSVTAIAATYFGLLFYHYQLESGAEREEDIANRAMLDGNFGAAKQHLLTASKCGGGKAGGMVPALRESAHLTRRG